MSVASAWSIVKDVEPSQAVLLSIKLFVESRSAYFDWSAPSTRTAWYLSTEPGPFLISLPVSSSAVA